MWWVGAAYLKRWRWGRSLSEGRVSLDGAGRVVAGRGNSKCKSTKIGKCSVSVRSCREASVSKGKHGGRCI